MEMNQLSQLQPELLFFSDFIYISFMGGYGVFNHHCSGFFVLPLQASFWLWWTYSKNAIVYLL